MDRLWGNRGLIFSIGLFRRFLSFNKKSQTLPREKEVYSDSNNASSFSSLGKNRVWWHLFVAAGRSPIILPKTLFFVFLCILSLPGFVSAKCIQGNCKNGKGVYLTTDGNKYIGKFKNYKLNGKGKWISRHGDTYQGSFIAGRSEGKGMLKLSNGESYIGDFVNGKFHGTGKYAFKNGDDYIGGWSYGKMHGEGTYYYSNGTNTKEFKNGIPHGQGRCEFANGDIYEGEWKRHAPHGRGVLTFTSGRKHAAIWEHGIPKEQLLEDYNYVSKFKNEPQTYDDDVDVYALVVGVASYQHMPSLKYTDDDAYQLYAFLKSPEGGAVPNDNIKVLVDDVATKNNILLAMDQLFSKADENDVVLLYMSGHGLEGSFIPSDFDGYNNQISYNAINDILEESNAKHKLLIADACHSGSLVASRGSSYAPAVNNYYNILENLNSGGTAMLLSSAAKEVSLEYSGLRQGVFSHFLMQGLSGKADRNHNKVVTISELYHYMYNGVRDYTQNAQSPILTGSYNKEMPVAVVR